MAILIQIISTVVVSFMSLSMGVLFTWPSSALMVLKSENTTLHRPLTEAESALLGSISSISGLIGCILVGVLLDRIGRKYCSILFSSISAVSWAMLAINTRVEVVLATIFLSGISFGGFVIMTVYVGEFSQNSIRGATTSVCLVFNTIGILVSYILGGLLSYWPSIYVSLLLSIFSTGLFFCIKESPVYLMKKGLEKEAADAMGFYRSAKPSSQEVQMELDNIRRALNKELDKSPEEKELNIENKDEEAVRRTISTWQFFKKSRSTRRLFYVTLIVLTAAIFQGFVVVQVYAQVLFYQAVPEMSATLASVLFGIVGVVAGSVAAVLSDNLGRRPLIIYSSIGAAVCCLLCGTQIQLQWGSNLLTPIFIYIYSAFYLFGAGTVPFILVAEVFLPEVKSALATIAMEWAWLCNFLILVIFDPLTTTIGLGPVFYLFSIICALTAVFGYFFLPETKGLSVDEIQDSVVGRQHRILTSIKK